MLLEAVLNPSQGATAKASGYVQVSECALGILAHTLSGSHVYTYTWTLLLEYTLGHLPKSWRSYHVASELATSQSLCSDGGARVHLMVV